MTDESNNRTLFQRFRRWLAYKLLPGTTEFNVAIARQRALQELRRAHDQAESPTDQNELRETYYLLSKRLPIKEKWDNTDSFTPDRSDQ